MTGRRVLMQILSWNFSDSKLKKKKKPQTIARKKWSKQGRKLLSKQLKEELNDKN